jgi:hypothetical protein
MNHVLHQLEDELARSVFGLTAPHAQLHPQQNSTRWNIYQIVRHLLLTYASTASSIEVRLAKGLPTRSRSTPSQLLAKIVVIRMGLLPSGREAPGIVTPPAEPPDPSPSGDILASEVTAGLICMDAILTRAEGHFSSTPCLSHFALGPLSIPQWRRFHLVHGRHHIRQILAIRREYRF